MPPIVILVRRVPIDRHGYDSTGRYWGVGAKLWCVEAPDRDDHIRAPSWSAAKARVRAAFPSAAVR